MHICISNKLHTILPLCPELLKSFFLFLDHYDTALSRTPNQTAYGKYVVFHKLVGQMMARLLCSVIGHLMVVDSKQELDALILKPNTHYWIDLNDIENEGNWKSSLTGNAGFIRWRMNEPSNSTEEDCGILYENEMADGPCPMKWQFICEV